MNEKSGELWKSTLLAAAETLILIILCTVNSGAVSLGGSGERVAAIQKKLKQNGAYSGEVSGIYDPETVRAVKKLFPDSGGEADREVIKSLGLTDEYSCFMSGTEIVAAYLTLHPENEVLAAEKMPSELLRGNPELIAFFRSREPDGEAVNKAIKIIRSH